MTSTTGAINYSAWDVSSYSGLLEDCTGYHVNQGTDSEGELCYWLIDAYGDVVGDPWYEWADVIHETVDAIEAQLRTINGD
jgi:hypothetical protein